MGEARQLATALADAMLAGPWELDPLRDRLRRVTAGRQSWLTALAREVVKAYPRPPSDRPRELAAFVLGSAALDRGRRTANGLPKPVVRLSAPTATVRRPFSTPVVDHVGTLAERLGLTAAELDTLADTLLMTRRARTGRIPNYRYQWLQRPAGSRLLEAPKTRLAAVQRAVLDDLLAPIPVHPAAHGFVRGRSAITGAAVHAGSAVVVTLDLEHFFSSITAGRIWGVLRAAGYPEPVAHLLAGLTTHASPVSALSSMPHGPDSARDFRLRRRLAAPHLPQGAPSSPHLANLVTYSLDRRIDAYSGAAGLRYTRYADDLTISGGPELVRRWRSLVKAVESMVVHEGFRLNPAKTRMRQRHQRQLVTGIVVNDQPNIARPEFDQLKAILHDCLLHGPVAANRQHHNDFRAHLLGRISWVGALNPARGAKLRAAFDAISWEQLAGSGVGVTPV